jgi:F-type H+-transporting ATPase subunit delta|tara:strand:- start:735 stop:1283 length:549 start_codon:yes stop_codon:yes gene_type:complete
MKNNRSAKRYSKALLLYGIENNLSDDILHQMESIHSTLTGSLKLRELIINPIISKKIKETLILKIFNFKNKGSKEIIRLLIKNNRIKFLDQVAQKFIELYNIFKNNKIAIIISATPLEKKIQLQIIKKIKGSSFSEIKIINEVDKSIGGGYILKIGDILFDESLSKKIEKLRRGLTLNNYTK